MKLQDLRSLAQPSEGHLTQSRPFPRNTVNHHHACVEVRSPPTHAGQSIPADQDIPDRSNDPSLQVFAVQLAEGGFDDDVAVQVDVPTHFPR